MGTYDRDNSGLLRDGLRSPGEVTGVEAESTVLEVTTTHSDGVDTLRTELGVGGLATELEFSLLAIVCALGTGLGAFVS